ncbi:hypothetical protein [Streptomyces sp. NPDC054961]
MTPLPSDSPWAGGQYPEPAGPELKSLVVEAGKQATRPVEECCEALDRLWTLVEGAGHPAGEVVIPTFAGRWH